MKIALCQMKMSDDRNENIEKSINSLKAAAENNADIVLFPELQLSEFFPQYKGLNVKNKSIELGDKILQQLYGAQIQTMMPKLHSTNFEGMELIRPLYLIREDDIKSWRDYNKLHFIQCACKFTDTCSSCGNEENHSKRVEIKELIKELKIKNPEVEAHIFKSAENVNLDTVIAYKYKGEKHHFLDEYEN